MSFRGSDEYKIVGKGQRVRACGCVWRKSKQTLGFCFHSFLLLCRNLNFKRFCCFFFFSCFFLFDEPLGNYLFFFMFLISLVYFFGQKIK